MKVFSISQSRLESPQTGFASHSILINNMQSLLAIGDLTGNEYLAGSTTALTDLHFLIDNDTQADDKWKYNQDEFPEY
jgi:hypothetical protein